ncbi:hypothetical protein UFOVP70_8 [uncultured Caudovirales phage]|uniref:Uncharacterized protein n=1 Tax=uncultured Caudovirales phage TaxID=2100421 RepID=A0A6J5KV35_9CAUD|nr:hypothetical protein UFOVP70_8 [uncultured Caudovirales phage]
MSGDHNLYASGSGDGQRSGWRKRTIMEMANETLERMEPDVYCREHYWSATDDELKAFEKLVREEAQAEEREQIAQFIEKTNLGSLPEATAIHYALLLKTYANAIRARGDNHD